MRTQYCREHVNPEVAKECGISDRTVKRCEQAAEFCEKFTKFGNCSTDVILALIDVPDEPVRDLAISLAENLLNAETPTKGKVTKKLTGKKVKDLINAAELEVRGEIIKKIKREKKSVVQDEDGYVDERPIEPAPAPVPDPEPAPETIPPPLPPDAPMKDVLKRDEELLAVAQKHTPKTQEQIRKEKAEQLDRAVNAMLDLMSSKPRNHIKELKEKYIQFETQADVIDMALDFMAEKWKP